jgi:hypothetical protein
MKTLITIALLTCTLIAQERMLLHIGPDGRQEAIPIRPGERTQDAIERMEARRAQKNGSPSFLVDTMRYFTSENDLTTNFGFTHQDVAMQWYKSPADGEILEFWWKNLDYRGILRKGTVRAWYADPRLATVPQLPNTRFVGYYRDSADGDGGVQPFKPDSGDQWFYYPGTGDPPQNSYELFQSELPWKKGGVQFNLDSNAWQGISLKDWGDSALVKRNEYFAFTLSNDSKIPDVGAGVDVRMELATAANSAGIPYHSYKFYERGRTAPSNSGWHMRGDYEWGFYVVMTYTTCRPPKLDWTPLWNTISTKSREICITASGFFCIDPADTSFTIKLHYKIGRNAPYDSTVRTGKDGIYCFELPGANPLDTVYSYVSVQTSGSVTRTPVRSYIIFGPINTKLFLYNNSGFSQSNAKLIYTGKSTAPGYDYWSAPADGVGELPALFAFYDNILVADGSAPSRDIYPALKQWLASGTPEKPKRLLLTSQDYGCFIGKTCSDTLFGPGSWEYDYLGIQKIGPQNLLPSSREHRIHPMQDTVTNYLVRFLKDSNAALWYDPTFELGFAGSMDALVPRPEVKVLLREGRDSLPVAVKLMTASHMTMFASLDIGSLNMLPDTSFMERYPYWWINDVGSLSGAFFGSLLTGIEKANVHAPVEYALYQNYPNPFNPSTTISYSLGSTGNVKISIYNLLGQHVATVVNESKGPGSYRAEWNASRMASGMYFYELKANNYTSVKKMMLLK